LRILRIEFPSRTLLGNRTLSEFLAGILPFMHCAWSTPLMRTCTVRIARQSSWQRVTSLQLLSSVMDMVKIMPTVGS
jgi:hypothetical protein